VKSAWSLEAEQLIDVPDYQNIKVEQDNLVEFGLLPRSDFVEDSPETLLTATQSRRVNPHIINFPELPEVSKKIDFIVHQRICSHEKNAPFSDAVLLQGEAKNYSIVHVLSDRIAFLIMTTVARCPQTCHEGMLVVMIRISFIAPAVVIGPFDLMWHLLGASVSKTVLNLRLSTFIYVEDRWA
jgi:hypothetical protein